MVQDRRSVLRTQSSVSEWSDRRIGADTSLMKTFVRSVLIVCVLSLISAVTPPAQAAPRISETAVKQWTLSMTGICPPGMKVVPRLSGKTKTRIAKRVGERTHFSARQLHRLALCAPVARIKAAPRVTPDTTTPAPPSMAVPVETVAEWRAQMLTRVNELRVRVGATRLTMCAPIERAAQKYADVMAGNGVLSHTGPDGSQPWHRIAAQGYQWRAAGENIARGYPDVGTVMAGWIASPGHYANLINTNFRHVGFGLTKDGSGNQWWAQKFGAGGSC
jgi:uncharacterized protein YkwD